MRRVQAGFDLEDRKLFETIGAGVREIRIRYATGIFRIMYVVKFLEAIFVLHSFRKTSQATPKEDKHIASVRYRAIIRQRGS